MKKKKKNQEGLYQIKNNKIKIKPKKILFKSTIQKNLDDNINQNLKLLYSLIKESKERQFRKEDRSCPCCCQDRRSSGYAEEASEGSSGE